MNNLSNEYLEFIRKKAAKSADYVYRLKAREVDSIVSELLALREAQREPVAWQWHNTLRCHVTNDEERARNLAWDGVKVIPLYAAPQPPVWFGVDWAAPQLPAVPDGWVMVPKEPTESMVIDGFESEPDRFFSKPWEWEAYEAMSGCQQAAHRAKLCWAAMIAAAPKSEVK